MVSLSIQYTVYSGRRWLCNSLAIIMPLSSLAGRTGPYFSRSGVIDFRISAPREIESGYARLMQHKLLPLCVHAMHMCVRHAYTYICV